MTKKQIIENKIIRIITKIINENQHGFGIRWSEFDKNDRLIKKEKQFNSHKLMMTFLYKLTQQPNFNRVETYSNYNQSNDTSEFGGPTSI